MKIAHEIGYFEFVFNVKWEYDADEKVLDKFKEIFDLIDNDKRRADRDKLLGGIDFDTFRAFNLIGKRHFMMVGRTKSNRSLQNLSLMLTVGASAKVDLVPATEVYTLDEVIKEVMPIT